MVFSLTHIHTQPGFVYECGCMQVTTCLQRPEDSLRCWSSPSILFGAESLVHHGMHQASWPLRTWGFSCLSRPALSRHNEITVPGPVWILGIQTQDLTSTQQVFYALSHFSSPEKSPLWGTICAKYLAQGLSVVGPRVHGSCHCPRCPEASTRNT